MIGELVTLAENWQGYYVKPQGTGPFPAVVVFMEAFGLNDFIKVEVCDRLAQTGIAALAPDFFHGEIYQYSDMPRVMEKLKTLSEDTFMAETGKGLEFLAQQSEIDSHRVGAIGFCLGGRLAFLANILHAPYLKATVCCYGGGIAAEQDILGRPSLLDQVDAILAPLLLIYGADDQMIAPDEHGRIVQALSIAKKRYTLSVFPGAGHGFLSATRDSPMASAANVAWQMTIDFFKHNLK